MTATPSTHAAIVLAAGGSQRLGRPKQLLTRNGETLVHRVVRLARATAPMRLLVVLGAHEAAIRAACADADADYRHNAQWQLGLAGSLICAADVLRDHAGPVLLLGCDQPALALDHLQQLLAGAAQARSHCAATAHADGLGSPAVITAAMLQRAGELRGDRGFGPQLRALPSEALWRLDAPELQLDVDIEADVHAAIDCGWLDRANQPPS